MVLITEIYFLYDFTKQILQNLTLDSEMHSVAIAEKLSLFKPITLSPMFKSFTLDPTCKTSPENS